MWDFEGIDAADSVDDSGLFEIEPMNEMVVDKNVNLYSMVKSCDPDSVIWFAQVGYSYECVHLFIDLVMKRTAADLNTVPL